MNSFWAEQQARQHIRDLMADAAGDQLVALAETSDAEAANRPATPARRVTRTLSGWLDAIVTRSHRPAVPSPLKGRAGRP